MNYPIIKYSRFFTDIINTEILVSDPPTKPISPKIKDSTFGGPSIFGVAVAITELCLSATGKVALITVLIFFIYDIISWISQSSKHSGEFNKEKAIFQQQTKNYEADLIKYNNQIKNIRNSNDTQIYRNNLLVKSLEKALKPTEYKKNVKKGVTESYFYTYLQNRFPNKIFTDYIITEFPNGEAYIPDFIYQDKSTNLHIDIEIDEPYDLIDNKPIHYNEKGKHIDKTRDEYFTWIGWFVIRFSEEQVVKHPNECCNIVSALINHCYNINYSYGNRIDLIAHECWDYQTALNYCQNKFRESYLEEYSINNNRNISQYSNSGIILGKKNIRKPKEIHNDTEYNEDDLPF